MWGFSCYKESFMYKDAGMDAHGHRFLIKCTNSFFCCYYWQMVLSANVINNFGKQQPEIE